MSWQACAALQKMQEQGLAADNVVISDDQQALLESNLAAEYANKALWGEAGLDGEAKTEIPIACGAVVLVFLSIIAYFAKRHSMTLWAAHMYNAD